MNLVYHGRTCYFRTRDIVSCALKSGLCFVLLIGLLSFSTELTATNLKEGLSPITEKNSLAFMDCNNCCTRSVFNTTQCDELYIFAFFLSGNRRSAYRITSSSEIIWKECNDGTLQYTATNLKAIDGSHEMISLDFTFTEKSNSPDARGLRKHSCDDTYNREAWVYYSGLSGSFTSSQHGTFSVKIRGSAFQVGNGANTTSDNLNFGASCWIDISGGDGYWTAGAINVMLSPNCTPTEVDSDNDGVCDQDDCQPLIAIYPGTPGTPCDDDNSTTINDEITADGCACAGMPISNVATIDPCGTTLITSENGAIKVSATDGAPVISIQVFTPDWQPIENCWDNACNKPVTTLLTGSGDFIVYLKYFDSSYNLICEVQKTVSVAGDNNLQHVPTTGGTTGCGVSFRQSDTKLIFTNLSEVAVLQIIDLARWTTTFSCTPWGDPCQDTVTITGLELGERYMVKLENYNPTCIFQEEIVIGEIVVDSCENSVGDSYLNGICDEDLIDAIPASTCPISFTTSTNAITVSGLVDPVVSVMVFNADWETIYSCTPWETVCSTTQLIDNLAAGEYRLKVITYTANWVELCYLEEIVTIGDVTRGGVGLVGPTTDQTWYVAKNKQVTNITIKDTIISVTASNTFNDATTQTKSIIIYPNPAYDELNISLFSYVGQKGAFYLLNGIGQVVATNRIDVIGADPIQISLQQVEAGIYYLQILVDGYLVGLQKVIVEKR